MDLAIAGEDMGTKPWIVRRCLMAPDEVRHIDKRISAFKNRGAIPQITVVECDDKHSAVGMHGLGWHVPRNKCNNGERLGPVFPDNVRDWRTAKITSLLILCNGVWGHGNGSVSIFRTYFCI
jgi:hypothetical protein